MIAKWVTLDPTINLDRWREEYTKCRVAGIVVDFARIGGVGRVGWWRAGKIMDGECFVDKMYGTLDIHTC